MLTFHNATMSPRATGRSRQPGPPAGEDLKTQHIAAGSQGHVEEPPADEDAESIHSNTTQELGAEGLLRHAEDYRERITELGGKPTRPIAEYSREFEETRLHFILLGPSPRMTIDEEYYRHYCFMERNHFDQELMAWQSFMKWFRRKWVQQNEAAGGSLPPPPPVLEIDPLDLHTQYLGFMLLCRKEDEKENSSNRNWNFESYEGFLEHITAVEKQVAEMREKQGPEDDARFQERLGYCGKVLTDWGLGHPAGFQEQLGIVAKDLASIQSRRIQNKAADAAQVPGFLQQVADNPEPDTNGSSRKRAREDEALETGPAFTSTKTQSNDDTILAPKRTKRGGPKDKLGHAVTSKQSSKKPGGEISGKTHDDEANHEAEEAKEEVKPDRKWRGRPPKPSQPTSALETDAQGRPTPSQKRRGGPRDKTQLPAQQMDIVAKAKDRQSAKKKATVGRVQKHAKTLPDSSPRRSPRLAEKAKKKKTS